MSAHVVADATCLGCGLACDDVTLVVEDGRIAGMSPACSVGRAWFGDGRVPARIVVRGAEATFDAALGEAAALLGAAAGRALVVLSSGLATAAVREGIAIADGLRAAVDTATSPAAAEGILAVQRRGRAAATLGEIRARADVVVFWGCDPVRTHPRFLERIVPGPALPDRSGTRTVLAVQVGPRAPEGLPVQVALDAAHEAAALGVLRSLLQGTTAAPPAPFAGLAAVAEALRGARYVGLVAGGEGDDPAAGARAEALAALTLGLNGPTRAALVTLRAGGNRTGVESALTWQTGYPFAVDFASGAPHYEPAARGLARLWRTEAVLVLGEWTALPDGALAALGEVPSVVVGPRASEAPFAPAVAIDTGVAGIHEGGTAYRLDDVPLPLTPVCDGARTAAMTVAALREALARAAAARGAA
jgi:formylmethanofuran dehydrogenase subunit B